MGHRAVTYIATEREFIHIKTPHKTCGAFGLFNIDATY